jgi:hypothetical protein
MGNSFPVLKVHCWGGFGSQLFSILVAKRLKTIFPNRRICIVFHQSGITQRNLELPESLICEFKFIVIRDFQIMRQPYKKSQTFNFRAGIRRLARHFLQYLFFVTEPNSEELFLQIKPWTLSTRGHYSKISLSLDEVNFLKNHLSIGHTFETRMLKDELTIHFRLGDLKEKKPSSLVSPERILKVVEESLLPASINIFSDSSGEEVQEIFSNLHRKEILLNFCQGETLQTIRSCFSSSFFLGTNSKLSIWVSIFRYLSGEGQNTYLPKELEKTFNKLIEKLPPKPQLTFYA